MKSRFSLAARNVRLSDTFVPYGHCSIVYPPFRLDASNIFIRKYIWQLLLNRSARRVFEYHEQQQLVSIYCQKACQLASQRFVATNNHRDSFIAFHTNCTVKSTIQKNSSLVHIDAIMWIFNMVTVDNRQSSVIISTSWLHGCFGNLAHSSMCFNQ